MTEEETRAILKTRLDRWQVYLGDEKPFLSEPVATGTAVSREVETAPEMSLALAVVEEEPYGGDADETTASAANEYWASSAPGQAARIAALEFAMACERERTRRLSEAMARELHRVHVMARTDVSRNDLSPNHYYATNDMPRGYPPSLSRPIPSFQEQGRRGVFILISAIAMLGLCGIFLYLLTAM
jgi:hypothetical protein